ncbi:MAG: GTPase HflX, partial [Coriobacteriaceae bacterium]|nr:GTPase HflX [Coriobacteriaceae bacterium]
MARFEHHSTAFVPERAILVGVDLGKSEWLLEDSLAELGRLAQTDGAEVVGTLTQRLDAPVPKTFIGKGKVDEVVSAVRSLDADVVIFDDELSPSQQVNLEKIVGEPTKIIDRTALILDIFGQHATTREGRL